MIIGEDRNEDWLRLFRLSSFALHHDSAVWSPQFKYILQQQQATVNVDNNTNTNIHTKVNIKITSYI